MGYDDKRIFVGGLRYETDEMTVRNYFIQFGPVTDVKIVKFPPPDGRSKGFGFVRFGTMAAKDHCMSESSHTIDGKAVELRHAEANTETSARSSGGGGGGGRFSAGGASSYGLEALDAEDVAYRRLFVGNVEKSWSEDVLREYFEQIGDIQELTIKRGPDGKCLGFAFMTFRAAASVDQVQQSRPHNVQGRTLETRRQTPKQYVGTPEAKLQVKKIWIGAPEDEKGKRGHSGLGDNTSDEDLEKFFSSFGTVTKVNQLMWVDTKKKRGYGYIEFADSDSVDKVVLSRIHVVNGVRLEVKKAVTRQPGEKGGMGGSTGQNSYGMGGSTGQTSYGMGGSAGGTMMGMSNMGGYGGMGGGYGTGMGGMMGGMMDTSSMYGGGSTGWGTTGSTDTSGGYGMTRKRGMDGASAPMKRAKMEPRDPESEIMRRMFIGNLNPSTTDSELEEYFNKFGQVASVSIKTHSDTKKSRGFGFVIFRQSRDVDTALASRPHMLMGAKLDCKRSTPKSEGVGMEERVKKIWIGKPDGDVRTVGSGLIEATTDEVLEEYFSQFGKVVHIHQFVWNDTNKKRGYGYITFEDEDVVDKIVLLGIHRIAGVNLYTKKAVSKELLPGRQEKSGGGHMGGMSSMGGMTNMGGVSSMGSMGGMSGNMGNMGMMHMGGSGMGGGNQNVQNMMSSMQNNMQSMMSQMPQATAKNPTMQNMMGNMQNIMSQMNHMSKQANKPDGGAKIHNMMSEMNNMIGSIGAGNARLAGRGKEAGHQGEEVQDKMMSMMNNMMSMMNNMAGMMQGGGGTSGSVLGEGGAAASGYDTTAGYGAAAGYGSAAPSSYGAAAGYGAGGYDYSGYSGAGYGGAASTGYKK